MVDGVASFLGVPFAQPPIGALRWCPPAPVVAWDGVREARGFGNPCVQRLDAIPVITERQRTPDEDCLYLNVWTSAPGGGGVLPVMVWFHGGAFVVGSGSAAEFDGRNLAGCGVVVVTVNYRLGPFGFLSHPELAAESSSGASGNYGLLDQLAALEWVRENIEAFGGDPGNVTIFGESAGAISVSAHVASPRSRGLFARAISQSATWFTIPYGLPEAHSDPGHAAEDAQRYAARLGCTTPGRVIAELRTRSAHDLLEATQGRSLFAPIVDGWFLPEDPAGLYAAGRVNQVPYLLGSNTDEGSRFADAPPGSAAAAEFASRVVVEPERQIADVMGRAVWRYRFSRVPDTALGAQFGAYHGLEVPYVFGTLSRADGFDDDDIELSRRMMAYWTTFARTGDPNTPGLAQWNQHVPGATEGIEFQVSTRAPRPGP